MPHFFDWFPGNSRSTQDSTSRPRLPPLDEGRTSLRLAILGLLTQLILAAQYASSAELYVNNEIGIDSCNGLSPVVTDQKTGPTRTIRRALELAKPADVVHVAPGSGPYFESLSLVGSRHSGVESLPFTIEARGATISGARRVPPDAWVEIAPGTWRFIPVRKGFAQLFLNQQRVPERVQTVDPNSKDIPLLQEHEWCYWKGSILYQQRSGYNSTPSRLPLEFAYDSCGITLVDVEHVLIIGLHVERFRQDGINVHDRARNILLQDVELRDNGRAGLVTAGTSLVGARNSRITGNRLTQVLGLEKSWLELLDCKLDSDIGERTRSEGGTLLELTGAGQSDASAESAGETPNATPAAGTSSPREEPESPAPENGEAPSPSPDSNQ